MSASSSDHPLPDHEPSDRQPPYDHPAGGWGALAGTARTLAKHQSVLRGSRALLRLNQHEGFDCPGCAWPEGRHRSAFEFCENGAKAIAAETTTRRADADFFARHSLSQLREQSDHWLEQQGRLSTPLCYDRDSDHYRPISWEEAFQLIARELNACAHPDRAVFYTSGRTSNEAAFLYQLFGRAFGTNNFPDCSNMCHESSGSALGESIGIGKGTVLLEDFEEADCILVIGQNPGTNHPRMLPVLQDARRRGADIVVINPLREAALERFVHPQRAGEMLGLFANEQDDSIASRHLQPLVGGDLALLTGVIKTVLEAERFQPGSAIDQAFIDEHTDGFAELQIHIDDISWDVIVAQSGIQRSEIESLATLFLTSRRVIACWAMGLTQHKHAVPTIQAVVNLLLLGGHIGRPGAGLCPVRGHSNVQGDRTVGITERPPQPLLDGLQRSCGFSPPTRHGFDVVAAIDAMATEAVDVFIGMGGNFVAAAPDTAHTAAALERCSLTVQVSTKLNRTHLHPGRAAVILPCLGRSERDIQATGPQRVTVEDSMSMVHASQGRLPPASEDLRSEPAIVASMAAATLGDLQPVDWHHLIGDYAHIRALISDTLPELFHDYEARLDQAGGFHLRNSAREREWCTLGDKARFRTAPIPDLTLPPGQLRLMTLRSHDQYNTTIYGLDDRYRGVHGERRVVFCHPDDLADRGLTDGAPVRLVSCFPDRQRRAEDFRVKAYDIPRGCAAAYFPEANALVSVRSYADGSRTPTSKFIPLRIEPA